MTFGYLHGKSLNKTRASQPGTGRPWAPVDTERQARGPKGCQRGGRSMGGWAGWSPLSQQWALRAAWGPASPPLPSAVTCPHSACSVSQGFLWVPGEQTGPQQSLRQDAKGRLGPDGHRQFLFLVTSPPIVPAAVFPLRALRWLGDADGSRRSPCSVWPRNHTEPCLPTVGVVWPVPWATGC